MGPCLCGDPCCPRCFPGSYQRGRRRSTVTKKQHYLITRRITTHTYADTLTYRVVTLKDGVDPAEYARKVEETGGKVEKVKAPPSIRTMSKWMADGVVKATDGCRVEPDGHCQHGKPSWLLALRFI